MFSTNAVFLDNITDPVALCWLKSLKHHRGLLEEYENMLYNKEKYRILPG